MSVPLVSVIIPTFNRAARVQRAIVSALEQSHSSVEIIVVDDGSTDGTAETLSERFGNDPRVQLIRTDNRGAAAARNTGLDHATGSHVAFLDSDDEWCPWKLEFQLECLHTVPEAGLVWSDMRAVDPDDTPIADRYLRSFYHRYAEVEIERILNGPLTMQRPEFGTCRLWHGDLYQVMLGGNLIHTSTVLMTRQRLEVVTGFDETLVGTGEDFDFHLRSSAAGPVAFADIPTITYRIGAPDQLTRPDLMLQMATNFVASIEKAIVADGDRTHPTELRRARGGAHGWLGEEMLAAGHRAEAIPHLRRAMRGPRPARATMLYLLARLPTPAGRVIRRLLGRITRPLRRR